MTTRDSRRPKTHAKPTQADASGRERVQSPPTEPQRASEVTPQGNAVPIETQIEGITLPQFYGIPKVHKNPIKLRPIAPCHSAIQNPMAKLISKILKPFVEITPSICGGTKELAIEFSTLRLPRFEQFWLVSGDIVAYYPNIPVVRAIEDVVYETHRPDSRHIRAKSLLPLIGDELFTEMLTAALTNLVVSFEGLPYLQTDGVAMGVAASPDIANLYAAPADRSLAVQREVKFLKRYINDIFSIIKAPTAEEALNIAKRNWQLAGCTVDWATPGKTCVFLDMFIYLDERNQIQWKPFRKAHNHLERVPWDSSHPIDVKRGTFIGELSRLAVLSSRFDHYSNAASDLAALYQQRGYPDVLVCKWLREHLLPRWENRFADRTAASHEEHLTTIALKTHFNDAWNNFSINELVHHISKPLALVQDTWRQGWFGSLERPIEAWQLKLPFFGCSIPFPREDFPALDWAVSSRDCWMETADGVVYGKVTFFDLQQLLCDDAKWVVSRRRTKRFGDLALTWRRSVMRQFTDELLQDPTPYALRLQRIDESVNTRRFLEEQAISEAHRLINAAGFTTVDTIDGPPRSVGVLPEDPSPDVQWWLRRFNTYWEVIDQSNDRRRVRRRLPEDSFLWADYFERRNAPQTALGN